MSAFEDFKKIIDLVDGEELVAVTKLKTHYVFIIKSNDQQNSPFEYKIGRWFFDGGFDRDGNYYDASPTLNSVINAYAKYVEMAHRNRW